MELHREKNKKDLFISTIETFQTKETLQTFYFVSIIFLSLLLFPANSKAQTYFQQEVNYTINVRLDDVKNELFANESIEYINNSPDALPFLYFHLWPNAYKNDKTALAKQLVEENKLDFHYAKDADRGYIDSLDFKVNGQKVQMQYMGDSIDICKIFLDHPLKPGEKITITTPFHVKIPIGIFSRLGHIDQQYQITQWYPKPAVYDNNGWNQMPFLNQGEFYSEFGSFDVSITLPKNYVLGATGDMVDGEKEMEWLNEKAEETKNKNFDKKEINVGIEKADPDPFPKSDPEMKTLRFKQSKVHDFAWFCDKRYNVMKSEVELPHSKRKVTTWVMFTNSQGKLWKNGCTYVNDALYYYSLWNGDYAYDVCTAVDGALSAGGGMEYPNITVIGESSSAFGLETVIMHEVGHNWFYGMLGSNERMHGWMDEGINSANENRYIRTKYPDALLIGDPGSFIVRKFGLQNFKHKAEYEEAYLLNAKKNEDQPIELPAWEYTELNYAGVMYSKTAIVFDYLRAYLGDSVYDKCGQKYFDEWCFKHPMPKDIRKIYEETSGKNLSWFFDDLINTTKKLDYKIVAGGKVEFKGKYFFKVKNSGEIAGPYCVSVLKDKKIIQTFWHEGILPDSTATTYFSIPEDNYEIRIDPLGDMPEIDRDNNILKTKGLFKKTEPFKLQFLGSLDDPEKTQLFYTPVIGWNQYNGFMAGLALYNNIGPEKKMEYVLMPMYGFGNKNFAGSGEWRLNFHPRKVFQTIRFAVNAERYAFSSHPFPDPLNFNKIAPSIQFDLKKKHATSTVTNTFKFREIGIVRDYYTYALSNTSSPIDVYTPIPKKDTLLVSEFTYYMINDRNLDPYNVGLKLEASKYFTKLSFEANYEITLKGKNKAIDFRFFAGTFLNNTDPNAGKYMFHLSGITGSQDYLYDNIFLGRTESTGFHSQQFSEQNGGFKVYSSTGSSKNWIASLNIKAAIPKVPLIHLFADIGTSAPDGLNTDKFLYDAGAFISIANGFLEVYFPAVMSNDFHDYINANGLTYFQTVRFTLNLNMANPFNFIRNFSL